MLKSRQKRAWGYGPLSPGNAEISRLDYLI
ncbi:hypothetical protein BLA15816_04306 [Burkholderia lata]|nr:hypothetical protein BLA15816_04306 [Burkholderia lata]